MSATPIFSSSSPTKSPTPKTSSKITNFITTPSLNFISKTPKTPKTVTFKPPPFSSLIPKIKNPKTHLPFSTSSTTKAMFTGIVEEMGQIKNLGFEENQESFTMTINARTVLEGVNLGDSIAVNGTCLTVTKFDSELFEFTVGIAPETLRKTSLGELEQGSVVNLERAVCPSTRMGGHFVQGHVDGTGEIVSLIPEGDSLWVKVRVDKELMRYIVRKGFITIDGASLTVVDVFDDEGCFNFMLVAYTQQHVVIPSKKVGQKVNVEVDVLGKYVERLLSTGFLEHIKFPRV